MRKLEKFISRLPQDTSSIVIRAGDTRNQEELCGHLDFPIEDINEAIQEIIDMLPIETMKFRCLAMRDGKQIKGITIQERRTQEDMSEPIQALTKGFLDMSYQVERILATANDTIEHQQDTIEYLVDSLVESREDNSENQLAVALLEMEKNQLEESQNQSAKEKALELGEKVLGQMIAPKITPQIIKEALKSNPEMIASFLEDRELVEAISIILAQQAQK